METSAATQMTKQPYLREHCLHSNEGRFQKVDLSISYSHLLLEQYVVNGGFLTILFSSSSRYTSHVNSFFDLNKLGGQI